MRHRWLAAALLFVAGTSAQAALVRVGFEGVNSSPSAANVFGEAVPNVSGYVIYESDTAGSLFSDFNGLTYNFAGAIKEVSLTLHDDATTTVFSGTRSGSFGSAQVRDGAGNLQDNISFNNMTLTQVLGAPAGFQNAQLTLRLATDGTAPLDPWNATSLPGVFNPTLFDGQNQLQVFIARATGSQPTGVAVNFNYNLAAVSVTPVPLPAAAWLLLSSLGGLVTFGRRRRQ